MQNLIPVALLAILVPPCAFSQAPCLGPTLAGIVHDSSAAVIPDATLTLDDTRTSLSNAEGRFVFLCVAPGEHHLSAHAPGFAEAALPVTLPHSASFDITLPLASVQTSVEVEAASSDEPASVNSVGPTQTFAGRQLQQLADDPDDLLRELQQLATASGGSAANTTIAVDGFQDSTQVPPKSSIASVKVNSDLFSAEYREPPLGGGGRVEIYTKPGQDSYHGALFTTNGSPWENARDPFSSSKAAIGKQRYGFEFGGPVRKVGSDFFTSLEYRAIDNFAVVNAVELDPVGTQVNIFANVATPQRLWLPTARVDWQLTPKNTFIAGYTGSLSNLQNIGVGGTALAETGYSSRRYDHTLRFSNITAASASLMHEGRVSFRWFGEDDTPNSTAPQVQVAGAFTGGGATLGAQKLNEFRLEVDDDIVLNTAHHTLKFGTQFFLNDERRRLPTDFNGTYIFGGGMAPVLDASGNPVPGQTTTITGIEQYRRTRVGLAGGNPTAYIGVTGSPEVNFTQFNNGLFLQDDWKLSGGVHIAAGLRYATQSKPILVGALTPRFSVEWTPGKDAKWTLHAHAGLFSNRFSIYDYAEILREDGTQRITRTVYNPVFGNPLSGGAVPIYSERRLAEPFTNSSYGVYSIGGTFTLSKAFTLSGDLGKGRLWNQYRSNNINAPFTDLPTGPRPFAPNLDVLQAQNSGEGRMDFAFFAIENHSLKRVQFYAGSVHLEQIDDTDGSTFFTPQNSRSNAGELARRSGQAAWQTFANGTFQFPETVRFSFNLSSVGAPLTTSSPASTTMETATSMIALSSLRRAPPTPSRPNTVCSRQLGERACSAETGASCLGPRTSMPTSSAHLSSRATPKPNTSRRSP